MFYFALGMFAYFDQIMNRTGDLSDIHRDD